MKHHSFPKNLSYSDAHVLVVETDPSLRNKSIEALISAGFKVTCVESPSEAKKQIDAIGDLQILLTNLNFPNGEKGIELAQYLNKRRPLASVIFHSGEENSLNSKPNAWRTGRTVTESLGWRKQLTQVAIEALV